MAAKGVKTKDGEELPGEVPGADAPPPADDLPGADAADLDGGAPEPFGAEVLRRLHKDCATLMKDYDEAMAYLEHDGVKSILQKKLENLAGDLDEIEKAFGSHYKDLPGLEGLEDEEPGEMPEQEVTDGDLPATDVADLDEEAAEDKDAETATDPMDDDAEPAASEGPPELTPPEEVAEAMHEDPDKFKSADGEEDLVEPGEMGEKRYAASKALRGKYKLKGALPGKVKGALPGKVKGAGCDCGQEPCECGKGKGLPKNAKAADCTDEDKGCKDLPPEEVEEAAKFLKDLGDDDSELDHGKKLKAYHLARVVKGLLGQGKAGAKSVPGSAEWAEEEANEPEHKGMTEPAQPATARGKCNICGQRYITGERIVLVDHEAMDAYAHERCARSKALKGWHKAAADAADYLDKVSGEKAFGDKHRAVAKALAKALEDAGAKALEDDEEKSLPEEDEEAKAVKAMAEEQEQQVKALTETVAGLAKRLSLNGSAALR